MISDSARKELIVLVDVVDKVDKGKPERADLDKLRAWLGAHPAVADELGNLALLAQHNLMEKSFATFAPSEKEFVKVRLEMMRDELGYDDASELEKSLIRHLMLCWVRLCETEMRYDQMRNSDLPLTKAEYWERRLNYAQRRFLRAAESLAKVSKLEASEPARPTAPAFKVIVGSGQK